MGRSNKRKVHFRKTYVKKNPRLTTSYSKLKESFTDPPELKRLVGLERERRQVLNSNLAPESKIILYNQLSPAYNAAYGRYRDTQSMDIEGLAGEQEVGVPGRRQTPKQVLKTLLTSQTKTPFRSRPRTTFSATPHSSQVPSTPLTGVSTLLQSVTPKSSKPKKSGPIPKKIDLGQEVKKTGQKQWRKKYNRLSSYYKT